MSIHLKVVAITGLAASLERFAKKMSHDDLALGFKKYLPGEWRSHQNMYWMNLFLIYNYITLASVICQLK